ncbi:MAG: restriction endonuclease, partial [Sphingopyxis sp.]|nr:restriction endonuclease [Sphingopyxis sp.]
MTKLPTHIDFYVPTLVALNNYGGSANIDEINDAIIANMGLSQAQLDTVYPKSGVPILPDRMSWARSYLKYPGLLSNSARGVWTLTEEGRAAVNWPADKVKSVVSAAANAD